ncbi:hypothetical protein F5883DRAFT_533499 [Diaporthe sp. PMI_573]|nr:hypothetical protein F5883DRAFT_533499 [Diaporthaceae sp. PMI_573]
MILEDVTLPSLASRETTVVLLNRTGDELALETETIRLSQGKWERVESMPPKVVIPGSSAMWHCKSTGIGHGIDGSVTYSVTAGVPHDKVRVCWKNRYFGPNQYNSASTRDKHVIEVQGGMGSNAVVVFVLKSTDSDHAVPGDC